MLKVSARLVEFCQRSPERRTWLSRLPQTVAALEEQWQLSIGAPFEGEGEASWVAPVTRRDGSVAVLKLGMPHFEADHEAEGLRFWNGDPTVRLLESDEARSALLLERCEPGVALSERPDSEQDAVLARLLPRMWRTPPAGSVFRPLAAMLERWIAEAEVRRPQSTDERWLRAGVETCRAMIDTSPVPVLLATDLHAGNVLRASRETWLVIDPKPFAGDPAYDATQHLLNIPDRLSADPLGTIARYAGLLEVDADRVRRWLFARLAIEPRTDPRWIAVTRAIERDE